MTIPNQIELKLLRARQHLDELKNEVATWFNQGPGRLVEIPESTPEKRMYKFDKGDVPARFGLIAGDYLQNLRSVLDYMVWHMIIANGEVPHETKTAFPVCKSAKAFASCYKSKLGGLPDEAVSLIEGLQPYPERRRGIVPQEIWVLDELNNQNKHRQVIASALASIHKPSEPVPFRHIELEITRHRDGRDVPGESILAFLVFEEGISEGTEVTTTLEILANYLGYEVLPQFEKFF